MDELKTFFPREGKEREEEKEEKEGDYYAKRVGQPEGGSDQRWWLQRGPPCEEIEAERAEGNFDSMLEVAEEALKQQGYTIEKNRGNS